jgi:hypothetical protein
MTSLLDKLNLRPGERRFVVVVGILVFVVLNVWLVWPSFGEWGRIERQIKEARKKLKMFDDELAKTNLYQRQMTELRQKGQYVATDDQASQLQREVTSQAALSGVQIIRATPGRGVAGGRTNSFFEEQVLDINVLAGEKELIDFLYNLGARGSLIRVRSMNLSRDPSQTRLSGSITLVESFQKKPPPRLAAITPGATAPKAAPPSASSSAARPAGTTAVSTSGAPPVSKAAAPTTKLASPVPPAASSSVTSAPPATAKPAPAKSTKGNWLRRLFSRQAGAAAKPRSSLQPMPVQSCDFASCLSMDRLTLTQFAS